MAPAPLHEKQYQRHGDPADEPSSTFVGVGGPQGTSSPTPCCCVRPSSKDLALSVQCSSTNAAQPGSPWRC